MPRKRNFGTQLYHGDYTPEEKTPVQRKPTNAHNCCFCAEPLHNIFEGETLVDLDCGHSVHSQCFHELVGSNTLVLDDPAGNAIDDEFNNNIVCPLCGVQTFCNDKELVETINNMTLLQTYEGIVSPKAEMENIIATLDEFEVVDVAPHISVTDNLHSSDEIVDMCEPMVMGYDVNDTREDPITPQEQTGMNFWNREETLDVPFPKTDSSSAKHTSPSYNLEINLANVVFAPETSSVLLQEKDNSNIECVVHVSARDFETPLESNRMEQIKTQIGKNKITNNILDNFKKNLLDELIDFSTFGSLVLFDFMNTTIKLNVYADCQVYLFESNIIILNNKGTDLLLKQDLNANTFISSIFENKDDIIINLNSIKVPSITFQTVNKIIKHKWYVVLKKLTNNIQVSNLIPLIQTSTNAWSLVLDVSGENDDAIPHDIAIVNKLTSKGLDLPTKYLNRQILRPDSLPKVLIVAIPLVNCEDYGLENNEFANSIKNCLSMILNSLNEKDKLGVVFLGQNSKHNSLIGNYYGCISKNWEGWEVVLESITENVISDEDGLPNTFFWKDGIKYVELLANVGFRHINDDDCLHQIIWISNEMIQDLNPSTLCAQINNEVDMENIFLNRRKKYSGFNISKSISKICEDYDANFIFILLADEFKFEPAEIVSLNRLLKLFGKSKLLGNDENSFNNNIKLKVALDFEHLNKVMIQQIEELNSVIIKKLQTNIKFPKYVKLTEYESPQGKIQIRKTDSEYDNDYTILLKNIPSGYERLLQFNIHVNYKDDVVNNNSKITIARSTTNYITENFTKEFNSHLNLKVIKNDSNLENAVTFNLNIEDPKENKLFGKALYSDLVSDDSSMNVPIVSKLSSVTDAYFVLRKIQLLTIETLYKVVLNVKTFDTKAKIKAKTEFLKLIDTIWELSNSCNRSNTNNFKENNIAKWSESLIVKLEDIIEGYSLRNYQLSNMKCVWLFLELE